MRLFLQVDLLIIKLNQHMPRISPMGMFQVNLELFPIVIAYSSHNRNMNDVFFFFAFAVDKHNHHLHTGYQWTSWTNQVTSRWNAKSSTYLLFDVRFIALPHFPADLTQLLITLANKPHISFPSNSVESDVSSLSNLLKNLLTLWTELATVSNGYVRSPQRKNNTTEQTRIHQSKHSRRRAQSNVYYS